MTTVMNYTNHLFNTAPDGGWDRSVSKHFVFKVDVLEKGKMGECKDLSEFDKGQIVGARQLRESIPITAALVWCSQSAVLSILQKWSKERIVVNHRQGRPNQQITYC